MALPTKVRAAILIGLDNINEFNAGGRNQTAYDQLYPENRDSILSSHYWAFAEEFKELQRTVSPPTLYYPFVYDIPDNFLQLTFLVGGSDFFEDLPFKRYARDLISTDREVAYLSYTRKLGPGEEGDAPFREAVAHKMAADLCYFCNGGEDRAKQLRETYKDMEFHAVSNDYRSQMLNESVEPQDYVRARVSSGGNIVNDSQVEIPRQPITF